MEFGMFGMYMDRAGAGVLDYKKVGYALQEGKK